MTTKDRAYFEGLAMKVVDQVATDDERRELDAYLADHPELREELTDFLEIKETTDAMTQRILATAELNPPPLSGADRRLTTLAFGLLLTSALTLLGFSGWLFLADPEVPAWIKFATLVAAIAVTILFGRHLRSRLAGEDPYEVIDR